jgi:hypothetical protein
LYFLKIGVRIGVVSWRCGAAQINKRRLTLILTLSKEQTKELRAELRKRARKLAGLYNDPQYFLDDIAQIIYYHTQYKRREEVKRLTHYKEYENCSGLVTRPVLCLCELKAGEIILQRHAKGSCPFINYTTGNLR